MFKQQFLLSVNENFGLHTKNILEPEIYRYKNNNISNKKKQTTPNLQFAGDVKFAGDNPIDPLSNKKNITLKINEPPFIGEIVSITTFPQRQRKGLLKLAFVNI